MCGGFSSFVVVSVCVAVGIKGAWVRLRVYWRGRRVQGLLVGASGFMGLA